MFGVSAAAEGHRGEQHWSSEREEKCRSKKKGKRNLFLRGESSQKGKIERTGRMRQNC